MSIANIIIEGNIGLGKSTLIARLLHHYSPRALAVGEPLSLFKHTHGFDLFKSYFTGNTNTFEFQTHILTANIGSMLDALYSSRSIRLFDRCPSASVEVFAQVAHDNLALEDYQFHTLRRALEAFTDSVSDYKGFLVVHLRDRTNTVSVHNTLRRYEEDRSGYDSYVEYIVPQAIREAAVCPQAYISQLSQYYDDFIARLQQRQVDLQVVTIDVSPEMGHISDDQFALLIQAIDGFMEHGIALEFPPLSEFYDEQALLALPSSPFGSLRCSENSTIVIDDSEDEAELEPPASIEIIDLTDD